MCPIPDFDHNYVLPPHLGNPTQPNQVSPYQCTIIELCRKFATSRERIEILKGYINFRQRLTSIGVISGFQWLDGSFLENIEYVEKRAPRDLDLITFYEGIHSPSPADLIAAFPEFADPSLSKRTFHVDHYPVDYTYRPDVTVEYTRYWTQLFTHKRNNVWKGMLKLSLNTAADDALALNYLNAL